MYKTKTLFIVGAGASSEANLPVGSQLRHRISEILNIKLERFGGMISGDFKILEALRAEVGKNSSISDINELLRECSHIVGSLKLSSSIDEYLETHQDNSHAVLCGKLAIVRAILAAERESLLRPDDPVEPQIRYDLIDQTWYSKLFMALVSGVTVRNIEHIFENVSFVVFNYDRCLEYFLERSLKNYFRISDDTARSLVNQANIVHPYGSVGKLSWQTGASTGTSASFGADPIVSILLDTSSMIKTYSEQVAEVSTISNIKELTFQTETIVFLGFAFHRQNMSLLKPDGVCKTTKVFGTRRGISTFDTAAVSENIYDLLGSRSARISMIDGTCASLFDEYYHSISRL